MRANSRVVSARTWSQHEGKQLSFRMINVVWNCKFKSKIADKCDRISQVVSTRTWSQHKGNILLLLHDCLNVYLKSWFGVKIADTYERIRELFPLEPEASMKVSMINEIAIHCFTRRTYVFVMGKYIKKDMKRYEKKAKYTQI